MSCFVKSNVELTMKLTVGDRVVTSSFRVEAPGFHIRFRFALVQVVGGWARRFVCPKAPTHPHLGYSSLLSIHALSFESSATQAHIPSKQFVTSFTEPDPVAYRPCTAPQCLVREKRSADVLLCEMKR